MGGGPAGVLGIADQPAHVSRVPTTEIPVQSGQTALPSLAPVAVTRPSRYPIVAQTPGGNYAEPGSGVQLGGWQTGAIFPSADANWLMRQITDWGRSLDASRLAATDLLVTNKVQRASSTALTITTGGGTTLTAEITAGGVYYGLGERIDLTDAPTVYSGADALVFPAGSTRYVIARPMPATGGAVSGSSCAELAISAVDAVAGWSTLMTVTTGAATITSAVQYGSVLDTLNVAHTMVFADTVDFSALATFDVATFNDLTDFNAATTFTDVSEWAASSIKPLIKLTPTGSGGGLEIAASGGTGVALDVVGGTAAAALTVSGAFAGSYAMTVEGTGGAGGLFVQGNGVGWGLAVNSGATAGSYGIVAIAQNNSGNAIYAVSANSGTAPAIKGAGSNLAAGVEAAATAYYPLVLSPDTSSPAYGSIIAGSQNAAPTNFDSGSLTFVGGAIDSWGHGSFADSAWRYFHSTLGGRMYGFATGGPTLNSNSAVYTTLCTVTIGAGADAAKVAGRTARLTVSMRVGHSAAATNFCDVQVRDTTAGATLTTRAGTGIGSGNGYYLPAVASVWQLVINFEIEYTVPATGARTFVLEFKRNSAASNVTAEGSLKVEGLY